MDSKEIRPGMIIKKYQPGKFPILHKNGVFIHFSLVRSFAIISPPQAFGSRHTTYISPPTRKEDHRSSAIRRCPEHADTFTEKNVFRFMKLGHMETRFTFKSTSRSGQGERGDGRGQCLATNFYRSTSIPVPSCLLLRRSLGSTRKRKGVSEIKDTFLRTAESIMHNFFTKPIDFTE